MHGLDPAEHLVLVPSRDGHTIDEADLIAAMTDDAAMLLDYGFSIHPTRTFGPFAG